MEPTTGKDRPAAALRRAWFSPILNHARSVLGRPAEGSLSQSIGSTRLHTEDMTAPFSGRSGPTKAQLIRREGGTT